jgi:predicted small integral membrane protein
MLLVRAVKVAVVAAFALHASLVTFGNLTDYGTNFAFVRHVLSMDTIFPDSTITWRAISNPTLHHAAYALIIATEAAVAALCWIGAWRLLTALRAEARAFNQAKSFAVAGFGLGLALWQVGFITIAGEWFGMWMSQQWNGITSAFHIVVILLGGLIFVELRDDDLPQPGG